MRNLDSALVQSSRDWAEKNLRPTLLQRDADHRFDPQDWAKIQTLGFNDVLFQSVSESEKMRSLASMFYGIARGSMDLPFCSSLAAHSVIAMDLMQQFMKPSQQEKYLPIMRRPDSIASVCNSEDGAGSDLKKIKALAEISLSGQANLRITKPCATNASHANLFLTSAWARNSHAKDSLCVLVLEKDEVQARSLQAELAGFRTGLTGGIEVKDLEICFEERALLLQIKRSDGQELNLFKRCFDMERLFLGDMVAGILDGMEYEMKLYVS
jgi:alkylation response protein AidB-like acyl-CoA dehydrogenase